jgi:class 3 adenylate cyclase
MRMKAEDPAMYYRLKAFFSEELNQPDSAMFYFTLADRLLSTASNRIMRSNFYNRWGQFCKRQGKKEEAIVKFKKAYELANSANYFEYMLTATRQIESLYSEMKDYEKAYYYSTQTRVISDSISNSIRKDQVIVANIMRDIQDREDRLKQEKEATDRTIRQRRLERNMMATGVGFMLLLSLAIFRNYRLQKKYNRKLDEEKQRSDDLLLNILPYETAEELKLTGSAEAKRFESVTVMFTDFKNFTQASERMSAEALVEEIHSYFSEFDKIIARHNIEKIKIIGDSYMCAGGLPVENSTHPFDVVSAALELQEFMASQKRIRLSTGRHFFELRIGIHTGPVVAGIVGIKKFAYDIWGDTVNTASRMENSGEVDRVNISGSTYLMIKDRFKCTYRGKVFAKNKGEIDMYFVEPF